MKKNRISGFDVFHSNDCGHRDHSSVNIPVVVLLGLILLGVNSLADLSGLPQQVPKRPSCDVPGQFISITGKSKTVDGVYFLTRSQLEEIFPGVAPIVLKTSPTPGSSNGVSAVLYQAGRPQKTTLPPELANIFFLPIPINSAGKDVICSLPGIGPVLAERIIRRRNTAGPFRSKSELLQIAGIGPRKFAGLTDRIFID